MTKILLAGATGMVGAFALARLLADPRVTAVVAPTRRPLTPHAKLLNPITTIDDPHFDADYWTVDAAIGALGTTRAQAPSDAAYRAIDFDYALAIAAQVRQRGATSFALVTSMGADPRSRFQYQRLKGELEDAVTAIGFPSLTIVRPGFLGGERRESRPMERIVAPLLRLVGPLLPATARISPAPVVAALLVDGALAGMPGKRVLTSTDITHAATPG